MDEAVATPESGEHHRWAPDGSMPSGQLEATYRLAAAIRRMNGLLIGSEMPEEQLIQAAEAAEGFAERLAAFPHGRRLLGYSEAANAPNLHVRFHASPVFGGANPVAPPLELRIADGEVTATVAYDSQYEGPPGHVHGGFIGAAFDDVLGMARAVSGHSSMTANLTVDYRSPTPLHRQLRFRGWIERTEGRKTSTRGELHFGERLCAEAHALFLDVDHSRLSGLANKP
jgi:acyl-coenzyme A thioesterase PaaI-like protein